MPTLRLLSPIAVRCFLLVHLTVLLCALGCNNSGGSGSIRETSPPGPIGTRQTIEELLRLYRVAILQEDIDRLDNLFDQAETPVPAVAQPQVPAQRGQKTSVVSGTSLQTISDSLRQFTMIALDFQDIDIAPDGSRVQFLAVQSFAAPDGPAQHTFLVRAIFEITQTLLNDGRILFRIGAVAQQVLAEVTLEGRVQPGGLTPIEVQGHALPFPLQDVQIEVPETGTTTILLAHGSNFRGVFTAPLLAPPQPLRVLLRGTAGEVLPVRASYQLHGVRPEVIRTIKGTERTQLFAVAVNQTDNTVWAGGDTQATIYRVSPGTTEAILTHRLVEHPLGRVQDIALDRRGRLHFLVLDLEGENAVVGNRDVVHDVAHPDILCPTADVFDPAYPFHVPDPQSGMLIRSPSTRVVPAPDGTVWLVGSDGGVGRVIDAFEHGQCPTAPGAVQYTEVLRRQNSLLPSNTVPALVVSTDGTLWFGTALGLSRFQNGSFAPPLLFDRPFVLPGEADTLEQFFQAVARAIAEAQPLTTVALGGVSFLEAFGRPVVKEDLIFSAIKDSQGRLWLGTLGGGLRHLEMQAGEWRDTLHVTRAEVVRHPISGARMVLPGSGIGSNIVFAVAEHPHDGAIWAATDEGVSHIQNHNGTLVISNFSVFDGITPPVRDIAIGTDGIVWLATGRGLVQVQPQGGRITGTVRDSTGQVVAGARVVVVGTPLRAVTDGQGRFMLTHVPPGTHHVLGQGVVGESKTMLSVCRDFTVSSGAASQGDMLLGMAGVLRALIRVSPEETTQVVGTQVELAVAVKDAHGNLLTGIPVAFTVTSPAEDALPTATEVPTGMACQATGLFTIGDTPGPYRVEARLPGVEPVVFTVVGTPDRRLLQVSEATQFGALGQPLPAPLVVRLENQFGVGLPGQLIQARIVEGDAVFLPSESMIAEATTDRQGEATFDLTLGAGERNVVRIAAARAAPVEFTVGVFIERSGGGIAVEADGNLVITKAAFDALGRFNPMTGEAMVLSGTCITACPGLLSPGACLEEPAAVVLDTDKKTLLVVNDFTDSVEGVIRLHPLTGNVQEIVSTCSPACPHPSSAGPCFVDPQAIVIEDSEHLLVAEGFSGLRAVVRVDGQGKRTVISGCRIAPQAAGLAACPPEALVGTGEEFSDPRGIVLAPTDEVTFLVLDRGLQNVVNVQPSNGNRTPVFAEPPFFTPMGIARVTSGCFKETLVVVDSGLQAVIQIDRDGNVDVLSGCPECCEEPPCSRGEGPDLQSPQAIAFDPTTDSLVVLDKDAIIRVNLATGNRCIVGSDQSACPPGCPQAP